MLSLSKSKLVALQQCPKHLWLRLHRPELAKDGAPTIQQRHGLAVGEAARRIYNNGGDGDAVLVDAAPSQLAAALAKTDELIGGENVIFEACIQTEGAHAYIDALLPAPSDAGRSWRMVEVKSSTKVKEPHLDDAAIQAYVARSSGIPLAGVAIAHVNNKWVYPGGGDYAGLLIEEDVTAATLERAAGVGALLEQAKALAQQTEEPERGTGAHCQDPYPCPFFSYCSSQEVQPDYPIAWLPRLSGKAAKAHIAATGATDMRDVPDELLSANQLRVKTATVLDAPYFDRAEAKQMLRTFEPPLYFLDFETIQFAVPIWPGTRPYQQIPFQFSLHWQDGDSFKHAEFLDLSGQNPQRAFANALIAACGNRGSIVAYSASFEKTRVKELAESLVDLRTELMALLPRFVDLLPIVRACYYHPAQCGSWSIKAVLPALCPDLSYTELDEVQDGIMAQLAFMEAVAPYTTLARHSELSAQLRAYCKLDTWAMVRVWQELGR